MAEIPNFRSHHGKRHRGVALFALACSAMLCGYRSYTAIAEWGRHYGEPRVRALGLTRRPPCAATLHTVFRRVDREALEAKLGTWVEGLLGEAPRPEEDAIAIRHPEGYDTDTVPDTTPREGMGKQRIPL